MRVPEFFKGLLDVFVFQHVAHKRRLGKLWIVREQPAGVAAQGQLDDWE